MVGIGPGDWREMTLRAVETLEASDAIVGYQLYIDLIRGRFPGKDFHATPMRGEAERCRLALALDRAGQRVAVICSGDAGVYGMAGLIYELRGEDAEVEVEVVGGLTAAVSGAALLGAPLGHDFAVVSLSDLLTPWEVIERRLECAAAGDFCVALYNPGSHKRRDALRRACEILLRHARADTVCGVARNIGRAGEATRLMTLAELRDCEADMFTTAFVGNSHTRVIGGKMITPRGYRNV
ncbi:MAG: precorrin-3B C(17)-methyltransferase [Clostridia bacterium]|nr:precorrin-3B C(17)-methyltransferase [Clostridia bacterium]